MNRITRSFASLVIVVGIGAGALATAGTAAAASPAAAHRLAADSDTQKKNKDGKDVPDVPAGCDDHLHTLNALVARMGNLNEVAGTLQGWLRSGDMSSEDYDSYYRGVNNAAHQVQRDFKAAMWRYLGAGCRALGPVPILPGWTDMQDAAHTLAG